MTTIAELEVETTVQANEDSQTEGAENIIDEIRSYIWVVWTLILVLLLLGIRKGSRKPVSSSHV